MFSALSFIRENITDITIKEILGKEFVYKLTFCYTFQVDA
jgi:hypothetical protein